MPDLSPALASLADATSAIARAASGAAATASDDSLLAFQREVAASARLLEQAAATFAAEIAFRSRRELGYAPTVALADGMRESIRWCLANGLTL